MKFKNINIIFGKKEVILNSSFEMGKGDIISIKGESGSGKTSLLEYLLNNREIRESSFYMPQNPPFIYHLNILENIHFLLESYSQHIDDGKVKDLSKKLDIDSLFGKYPNQLSGGEKQRVYLLIAIYIENLIIILDEPFASLDTDIKKVIIDMLGEKRNKQTTIIVSHENDVLRISTHKYYIENKKINEVELLYSNQELELLKRNMSIKKLLDIYVRGKEYCSFKGILKYLVYSFLIGSIILCMFFGSEAMNVQNNILSTYASNQVLVYKKSDFGDANYSFGGMWFDSEETDNLHNIEGVDRVWDYYDSKNMDGKEIVPIKCYNNQGDLVSQVNDLVSVLTYQESIDYSKRLFMDYNQKGVYITKELAEMLNIDKNSIIEIPYIIPVYTESILLQSNEAELFYEGSEPTGVVETLKVKVAGIIDGYYLDLDTLSSWHKIYIPYSTYSSLVEKNRVFKGRKDFSFPWFEEELGKEPTSIPYKPNAYIVEVNDVTHLEGVLKELDDLNFLYESNYSSKLHEIINIKGRNENYKIISLGMLIVLVGMLLVSDLIKKKDISELGSFLKTHSIDIFKFITLLLILDCILVLGLSMIVILLGKLLMIRVPLSSFIIDEKVYLALVTILTCYYIIKITIFNYVGKKKNEKFNPN